MTDNQSSETSLSTELLYRLSGERHRSIYNRIIRPRIVEGNPSIQYPSFVIICAQPGAGKSGLSSRLRDSFISAAADAVHVDVDNLREYHGNLERIKREDPLNMGTHTHEDVSMWKGFLLEDARKAKNNIVMEVTLRSAESTRTEIENFQKEGFAVELHAMAVHENVSRLGIFQRFEAVARLPGGTPRYVPMQYHDEAYHSLPLNVDAIEHDYHLSLVTVNNRAGSIVYERKGQWGEPAAMGAILLERDRAWLAEDKSLHLESWRDVMASMNGRPDGLLKLPFYVADMQRAILQVKGSISGIVVPAPAAEQNLFAEPKRLVGFEPR